MNAQGATLSTRERLYQNMSLLESIAEYARRPAGEGTIPDGIPHLSTLGRSFLADWQGHAATRLWLRLAQPTLDALQTYVDLDLAPTDTANGTANGVDEAPTAEETEELREAWEASKIAVDTLVERVEFLASRWAPDAAAS